MNKTALKFFLGALVLVLAGVGAVWGIDYYQKVHSPEYQAQLKFQELEARARADTYGGSTPEETLALFIDALKRGDIDLASKYFVVDEQEKWKQKLTQLISQSNFNLFIKDIELAKREKLQNDIFVLGYDTYFSGGVASIQGKTFNVSPHVLHQNIDFSKNVNDKWKILEL